MRKYVEEYYLNAIKSAIGSSERTIEEIIKILNMPRSTLQRWIDIFRAKGIIAERREKGKLYLSLSDKK
jgi:DNA-binding transcriptional ArsR family regulator